MGMISGVLRGFCSAPGGRDFRRFGAVLRSLAGSPFRRFLRRGEARLF